MKGVKIMENMCRATMSVEETAKYIGIGRNKLYTMIKEGKVPYIKFGKSIRIPRSRLEIWLQEQEGQVR